MTGSSLSKYNWGLVQLFLFLSGGTEELNQRTAFSRTPLLVATLSLKIGVLYGKSRRLNHMICAVEVCNAMILFQNNAELLHLELRVFGTGREQSSQIICNNAL